MASGESSLHRVFAIISGMDTALIDAAAFRKAMSTFPTGVTVVTTADGSSRWGMTVASFASLSLEPPLLLVCLESRVDTCAAIERTGHFGVSVLSEGQAEISNQFASRLEDRFAGVELRTGRLGDPLINGASSQIECRLHSQLPGGDHTIMVGAVVEAFVSDLPPLLYAGSRYHSFSF